MFKENEFVYILDNNTISYGIFSYESFSGYWYYKPTLVKGWKINNKPLDYLEKWSTEWVKNIDCEEPILTEEIPTTSLFSHSYKDKSNMEELVERHFIKPKNFLTPYIECEIEKNYKRYVVKWGKYNNTCIPMYENGSCFSCNKDNMFHTYEEAEVVRNQRIEFAKWFNSLSEEEQCLYEDEKYLKRYFPKDIVNKYMSIIKQMDNVIDLEIKITNAWGEEYKVYWRYFKPYKVKPLPSNNNHKETKIERKERLEREQREAKDNFFKKWTELKIGD